MEAKRHIFEFFAEGKSRRRSHALLHIAEADERTPDKGSFFAVCEAQGATDEQIGHLQRLIDDLESGYYETPDGSDQSAFEIALEYVNKRAPAILGNSQSTFHCVVGVLEKSRVYFSGLGDSQVFLFYVEDGARKGTVIEEARSESAEQLFSSVTEGTLNPDDIIFFSTPGVIEHFSVDRLEKILRDRSALEACSHIERALKELNAENSFAGVFIQRKSTVPLRDADHEKRVADAGSTASLNALIDQEKKTAETLSPPLLSSLSGIFHAHKDTRQRPPSAMRTSKRTKRARAATGESTGVFIARSFVVGVRALGGLLLAAVVAVGRFLRSLFLLATNIGGQRELIVRSWGQRWSTQKRVLEDLPVLSKLLLLLAILFVLIFLGSIAYVKFDAYRNAQQVQYDTSLQRIRELVDQAQASLIYDNAERALPMLQQAREQAQQFAAESNQAEQDTAPLLAQIEAALQTLRKIEKVEASLVVDFASHAEGAAPERISRVGSAVVAFSQNDQRHYVYDTVVGNVSVVAHDTIRPLHEATTPKEDDMIVFTTGASGVAVYDPAQTVIMQKEISFPVAEPTLTDLFVYNVKLYFLSAGEQQIYRHNPTQTGYDRGTPWLSAPAPELEQGRAIAIDGNIYVLTDSNVLKFVQGAQEPYTLTGIDPALSAPIDLWTYTDVRELYILDPQYNRVLIVEKESGKLLRQITAEAWTTLTAFAIDPERNTLFVLDGTKLYSVAL